MDSRIYVTHDNDLKISDGRVSDSGVWQCTAKNKVGQAIGETVLSVAGMCFFRVLNPGYVDY